MRLLVYRHTWQPSPQPVKRFSVTADMFKTEKLKALVNERLKAAAEEIFSIFETTIKDYEENVWRSNQEIEQQRRSLAGCKGEGHSGEL